MRWKALCYLTAGTWWKRVPTVSNTKMPDSIYVCESSGPNRNEIILVNNIIDRRKAIYDEMNFQLVTEKSRKPCIIIEGQHYMTFVDTIGAVYAIYEKQRPSVINASSIGYLMVSLSTLITQLYLVFVVQTTIHIIVHNVMRSKSL